MPNSAAHGETPQAAGLASHVVLCVDDQETNRYVRSRALRAAGFEVVEATNGAEALKLAADLQPALVVLDIRLPDLNGFEVCRRLKSDPRTRTIPVLHVSAVGRAEQDMPQALEHLSDAYLREPIDSVTLVATAKALIRAREAERRLLYVEERLAFLLKLTDALRPLADPLEVQDVATRAVAEQLGVTRAFYFEVDPDGDWTTTSRGYSTDALPIPQRLRMSDFGPHFLDSYRAGRTIHFRDTELDAEFDEAQRAAFRAIGTRAGVGVPLLKEGRLVAVLGLSHPEPRDWTDGELRLLEDAAERTWSALVRARAEAATKANEEKYRTLFDSIDEGYCVIEVVFDENQKPVDYRFLETNEAFERQTGLVNARGKLVRELVPGHEEHWFEVYGQVALTGQPIRFENRADQLNRWYSVYAYRFGPPDKRQVAVLFTDVKERKLAEKALRASEERQRFLLRLSDALRPLSEPVEIQAEAARLLGENLKANRTVYSEHSGDEIVIHRDYVDGAPSIAGRHAVADFGAEEFISALHRGEACTVDDVETDPRLRASDRSAYSEAKIASFISVGLVKKGQLVATFGVHSAVPRRWTAQEVELARMVAARTWDAVERARAERALRASEEKYRSLFDSIDEGFCIIEVFFDQSGNAVDYRFLETNPAFGKHTGLEDAAGKTVRELVPDIDAHWFEIYGEVALTGIPARFEAYAEAIGRHYDEYAFRIGAPDQRRVAIVFRDRTEHKRREANLAFLAGITEDSNRLSNAGEIMQTIGERIGAFLNVATCNFVRIDQSRDEFEVLHGWSRGNAPVLLGTYRLSEYSRHELREASRRGETVSIRNAQTDPRVDARSHAALGIGSSLAVPFHENGEWKYLLSITDSRPRDWRDDEIFLFQEISNRVFPRLERARAEEALRQAVERYEWQVRLFDGVASTTPDFVYLFDLQGRFVYANRRLLEVWGMELPEVTGKTPGELGYEQWQHDMHLREIAQVIGTKRPLKGEVPFTARRTGVFGIYEHILTPVIGPDGKVELIAGTTRDVTQRKQAEEALRESERHFRELADSMPQLVWVMDAAGSLVYGNRRMHEQLSTGEQEMAGDGWMRVVHPEDREKSLALWGRCVETGEPYEVEHRLFTIAREYRWFLCRAVPVRDGQGRIMRWFGTSTDIEESKRSEERLRQIQKLESIGLLAGGIAHDFNNLLTSVIGNASLVLEEVPPGPAERLREVLASADRAAHLTRQLLAYSGKGQFVVRDIDISQAVQETSDLVQFSLPKSVELAVTSQKRLPLVKMDPSQFQQLLMNLVINAGEAVGEGNPGKITVTTGMVVIEKAFLDGIGREIAPGRYVILEVRDTGAGIDEEQKSRIFDPFFTTKFMGRGLGLAAVAGIVRAQNGGILVESAPGRGSAFRVLLPVTQARTPGTAEAPQAEERATLMVVDDEAAVRDFISLALRRHGFRVLTAADGCDALAVMDREAGGIDVLVLDVVMPLMGASDMLPILKAKRPHTKVLLTSGYSELEARRLCAAHPEAAFIQKPYTAQQIARAVEELVGASG